MDYVLWDRVQIAVYSSKPGSLYELNTRITNAIHETSMQQMSVFIELEYPFERCALMMKVVVVMLQVNNRNWVPLTF